MNERLEEELNRKLAVLEEFVKSQPQESDVFFGMLKEVVQAALASHKTSTLKALIRELDTMAEEISFRYPASTLDFRERYWGQVDLATLGLVLKEVKSALRTGRVRSDDQCRAILIYLDQTAQGLRQNFLDEKETDRLNALAREFESRPKR